MKPIMTSLLAIAVLIAEPASTTIKWGSSIVLAAETRAAERRARAVPGQSGSASFTTR